MQELVARGNALYISLHLTARVFTMDYGATLLGPLMNVIIIPLVLKSVVDREGRAGVMAVYSLITRHIC